MSHDDQARRLLATNDVAAISALLAENAALRARLASDVAYLRDALKAERGLRSLSGESAGMKAMRRAIAQVAPTDSTVLIQGETGTGKELVARAIHQVSPRRDRLMVSVNCAACAESCCKRAVRPRSGRVHGGVQTENRPIRVGAPGHVVPR